MGCTCTYISPLVVVVYVAEWLEGLTGHQKITRKHIQGCSRTVTRDDGVVLPKILNDKRYAS